MKKVSVVIPTRNRAHLLRSALASASELSYDDLEIVVCDNNSHDDTPEVVRSFDRRSVIYLRTDSTLSMPDNWEFALTKTSGDYIVFLTDDSCIFPGVLQIATSVLESSGAKVAVWRHCAYYSGDWVEPVRRNMLYIPNTSGQTVYLNSADILNRLFSSDKSCHTIIPKSLNSICHRDIVNKVLVSQKRFFVHPCPDYGSAASVLLNTDRYVLIDRPFYIDGVTPYSIGAVGSHNRGDKVIDFFNEFHCREEELAYLGIYVTTATISKTLENVGSYYEPNSPSLDRMAALLSIADDLVKLQVNGVDVSIDLHKVRQAVAKENSNGWLTFQRQMLRSTIKWHTVNMIRRWKFLGNLERMRGFQILNGGEAEFNDILGSAKVAARLLGDQIRWPS